MYYYNIKIKNNLTLKLYALFTDMLGFDWYLYIFFKQHDF